MESLKKTFFGVVFLTAIFLLWTAILPERLEMSKSETYNIESERLYDVVSDFNKWEDWFPWRDSNMNYEIDSNSGVGQMLKWEHQEEGKGYLKMTEQKPDSLIRMDISFIENSDPVLSELRVIEKNTGETELQWRIYDTLEYKWPLGRIRAFMISKMSGRNIEQSLIDLKNELNKKNTEE